jgi:hypothetical protein
MVVGRAVIAAGLFDYVEWRSRFSGLASNRRHIMSQVRLNETSADAVRDRYRTSFANAFAPQFRYEQMPGADERTAYAAEFAAYRLGQIDEKLGRLIEIMERNSDQSSPMKK